MQSVSLTAAAGWCSVWPEPVSDKQRGPQVYGTTGRAEATHPSDTPSILRVLPWSSLVLPWSSRSAAGMSRTEILLCREDSLRWRKKLWPVWLTWCEACVILKLLFTHTHTHTHTHWRRRGNTMYIKNKQWYYMWLYFIISSLKCNYIILLVVSDVFNSCFHSFDVLNKLSYYYYY